MGLYLKEKSRRKNQEGEIKKEKSRRRI